MQYRRIVQPATIPSLPLPPGRPAGIWHGELELVKHNIYLYLL